jgi:nitrogen fixation/metabolism regulation signal transduction histidine kinase
MRRALDAERVRVRASERVAAWKETARRVAHEVKNPLAPIRLTVENLVTARERAPERFDAMFTSGTRAILEEVERLRRVVSEFSEYARLPEPVPRLENLDDIVDSVVALHGGDDRVTLRRERSTGIPWVAVDRDLVAQAIRNLVDNAVREAVEHGGAVVVRSGVAEATAFVEVRDHGAGLDDEALARALEPDFSAREGGSGLGLAIALRIAVEHGGLVSIANAPDGGQGAVATLRLPIEQGDRG